MFKFFGKFFGPEHETDKLTKEFIDHLENKYGKKFLPRELFTRGFQITCDEFRFYEEGTDIEEDWASAYKMYDSVGSYILDDYFGIIIREEYENMLKKEISKVFTNFKVFFDFSPNTFPDELRCGNTYEDALNIFGERRLTTTIRIFVEEEKDFDERAKSLEPLLKEAKIFSFSINIFNLKKGKLEGANKKNYNQNYVKEFTKRFDEMCYGIIDIATIESRNKNKKPDNM